MLVAFSSVPMRGSRYCTSHSTGRGPINANIEALGPTLRIFAALMSVETELWVDVGSVTNLGFLFSQPKAKAGK